MSAAAPEAQGDWGGAIDDAIAPLGPPTRPSTWPSAWTAAEQPHVLTAVIQTYAQIEFN